MALELDTRQRAMLQEMGVQVWLPEAGVVTLEAAVTAPAARIPVAPAMPPRKPQLAAAAAQSTNPVPGPVAAPSTPAATADATSSAASPDWRTLTETVAACQACTLCAGRSHTSLLAPAHDGIPCDWMVLGDPPDEDEDRAGAPFAGQDGVLLTQMLRALGLQRANPLPNAGRAGQQAQSAPDSPAQRAYVSNVLKCRPAHGGVPQAAELAQCSVHLQREIALVKPKLILSMGRFANQVLLGETPALAAQPLGKLRGTVHRYQGIAVVVSYPPKLLMRNSADKAKAWADLCLAAAIKLGT